MSAESSALIRMLAEQLAEEQVERTESRDERQQDRTESKELADLIRGFGARLDKLEEQMRALADAARTAPAAPAAGTKTIKVGKRSVSVIVTGRDDAERIESFEATVK